MRLLGVVLSIQIKMTTHTCIRANMSIVTRTGASIILYRHTCIDRRRLSMPKCASQRRLVLLGTMVESWKQTRPSNAGPLRWCCSVSNLQALNCMTHNCNILGSLSTSKASAVFSWAISPRNCIRATVWQREPMALGSDTCCDSASRSDLLRHWLA